jgi:IclR family mhp operon transcriptional activator
MLILESNRPLAAIDVNRDVVGFHPDMALSAMGRAYLAFCPERERRELIEALLQEGHRAERWRERVLRIVEETRSRGYAIRDVRHTGPDADSSTQFSAIAVPIHAANRVAACLSCVWLAGVVSESVIATSYLGLLQRTAAEIGARLEAGGRE